MQALGSLKNLTSPDANVVIAALIELEAAATADGE